MRPTVRFIHTADLHLDRPFKGIQRVSPSIYEAIKNSTFIALERLINLAIDEQVDFVLFVGDIFDQVYPSLYAEVRFKQLLHKLSEKEITSYISFGNHDYNQTIKQHFSDIEHCHVFSRQKVTSFYYQRNQEPLVRIHGFSYEERAVKENMATEFKYADHVPYHIGMLHGSAGGYEEHAPYAPFQLQQLKDAGFDYWALGHIHKRLTLSENPFVVYPGNIQGGSKKETGEKGCYIVELTDTTTTLTFHPLQVLKFVNVDIAVDEMTSFSQLYSILLENIPESQEKTLYTITLKNVTANLFQGDAYTDIEDIINVFNEGQINREDWSYIIDIKLNVHAEKNKTVNDPFLKTLGENINTDLLNESKGSLWRHQRARHFLDELTTEEEIEIEEEALALVKAILVGEEINENN